MRHLAILLVVSSASPVAAEPTGNALVWLDTPLHTDASETSPSIHLVDFENGREVNLVVPMHVVGTKGDFVEVEPAPDIECTWSKLIRPKELASMRLFVKRGDLAPVVAKPFTASWKDGTRVSLQAGVAVLDGKVAINAEHLTVDVPAANLASSYTPHAIAAPPKRGKHSVLLDEETPVSLGDKTFKVGNWVSGSAENRGERVLFPIAVRCISAVISAPKVHVHRDVSLGQLTGFASEQLPGRGTSNADRYYLARGQALTSETGDHVVATLAAELDVTKPTGATACADFVVQRAEPLDEAPHTNDAGRPKRTLHLCAPASAVKVEQRSRY